MSSDRVLMLLLPTEEFLDKLLKDKQKSSPAEKPFTLPLPLFLAPNSFFGKITVLPLKRQQKLIKVNLITLGYHVSSLATVNDSLQLGT